MSTEPERRVQDLLANHARLERTRQAVIAGLPELTQALLPVVRDEAVSLPTGERTVRYHVLPCRWTADPCYDAEAARYDWTPGGTPVPDTITGDVLCRNDAVLTGPPRPGLALVQTRSAPRAALTLIEDEGIDPALTLTINEPILHPATDADWRAVGLELHALLSVLERRLGEQLRLLESAEARLRGTEQSIDPEQP